MIMIVIGQGSQSYGFRGVLKIEVGRSMPDPGINHQISGEQQDIAVTGWDVIKARVLPRLLSEPSRALRIVVVGLLEQYSRCV